MAILRFTINGPTAKQNATRLVEQVPEAEFKHDDAVFRGGLFISIIEIVTTAGEFLTSIGGTVSLAHVVWNWHASRRNKIDSITISKVEEEKGKPTQSIILDDKITEADVKAFFESKY